MKIYLAARYGRRLEMVGYAADLESIGAEVVSTWIDGHHETRPNIDEDATPEEKAIWAREDLYDVARCDVLVAFTERAGTSSRGGRHVETGYALGLGKPVCIVGPIENVFHALDEVSRFDLWRQCVTALAVCVTPANIASYKL